MIQKNTETEKLRLAKERIKQKLALATSSRRLIKPEPPPQYDEVFAEGVAWLDSL